MNEEPKITITTEIEPEITKLSNGELQYSYTIPHTRDEDSGKWIVLSHRELHITELLNEISSALQMGATPPEKCQVKMFKVSEML